MGASQHTDIRSGYGPTYHGDFAYQSHHDGYTDHASRETLSSAGKVKMLCGR